MHHTDDLAALLGLTATADGWVGPVRGHDHYDGHPLPGRMMDFRSRMLDVGRPRTHWRRTEGDTLLFRHPPYGAGTLLRVWLRDELGRLCELPFGRLPRSGEPFQQTVPGGYWYAVELAAGDYGLWSEAVVPIDARPLERTGPWPDLPAPIAPTGSDGLTVRDALGLAEHIEGGYFREYYRSALTVPTSRGPRAAATTIHYLLDRDSPIGYLHRNAADITHFLNSGGPIRYLLLSPDGEMYEVVMGEDMDAGQALLFTCPGGWWKTSHLDGEADHGLISEIVAPGFEYRDQANAQAEQIAEDFPTMFERVRPYIGGRPHPTQVPSGESS